MASALRQAQGEALGNSRFEICSLTLNPYPYPEPVEGSRGAGIGDQPPSSFDRLRMRVWRQAILYPVALNYLLAIQLSAWRQSTMRTGVPCLPLSNKVMRTG